MLVPQPSLSLPFKRRVLVAAAAAALTSAACKQGAFSGTAKPIKPPAATNNAGNPNGAGAGGAPGGNGAGGNTNDTGAGGGRPAQPNNGGLLGSLGALGGILGNAIGAAAPNNPIPSNLQACSKSYLVPATANPWLAGDDNGTSLTYQLTSGDPQTPTDTAPNESPVLVAPVDQRCIAAGMTLYFYVNGAAAYSANSGSATADGELGMMVSHQLGGVNGKSDIRAPMSSLLGVFLGGDALTGQAAPGGSDYSGASARDYGTLSPELGQVFFIGTGRTANGGYHQVVVPAGATRLYFGVMDSYQWNNNHGGMYGAILIPKPH